MIGGERKRKRRRLIQKNNFIQNSHENVIWDLVQINFVSIREDQVEKLEVIRKNKF
jgi:hypothetical protein